MANEDLPTDQDSMADDWAAALAEQKSTEPAVMDAEPVGERLFPRLAGNGVGAEARHDIHRRNDRLFAGLMAFQWLMGIAFALWVSPLAWDGPVSRSRSSTTSRSTWARAPMWPPITPMWWSPSRSTPNGREPSWATPRPGGRANADDRWARWPTELR